MGIREVKNDDEFNRIMSAYKHRDLPIFVQFVSKWNWNCILMNKIFIHCESQFIGIFVSVNVKLCPKAAKKHIHGCIPVYKVFQNGRERASVIHIGINGEQLVPLIKEYTITCIPTPPKRPPRPYRFGEKIGVW